MPALVGAQEALQQGIYSTLQPSNAKAAAAVTNAEQAVLLQQWQLLLDPQTGV